MFLFLVFSLFLLDSFFTNASCPETYYAVDDDCVPVVYNLIVCDGDPMTMTCPKNRRIRVLNTVYGRHDHNVCPFPQGGGHNINVTCTDEKTQILRLACDGLQECKGPPPIVFDWDPCYNTYKYLDIDYVCEIQEPDVICEQKAEYLKCCHNEVIHIKSALWGRTSSEICQNRRYSKNTNCQPDDVTSIIMSNCEDRNECWVHATNSFVGSSDPCPGTYKYLKIDYDCVSRVKNVKICDGNQLSMGCAAGLVVRVLTATYGRTTKYSCPKEGKSLYLACRLDRTAIIKQTCDGLPSCNKDTPAAALSDDPCPGVYKYLDIDYTCETSVDLGSVY